MAMATPHPIPPVTPNGFTGARASVFAADSFDSALEQAQKIADDQASTEAADSHDGAQPGTASQADHDVVLIVPVFESSEESPAGGLATITARRSRASSDGSPQFEIAQTGLDCDEEVFRMAQVMGAQGSLGSTTWIPAPESSPFSTILLVGAGSSEAVDDKAIRFAAGRAARALKKGSVAVTTLSQFAAGACAEGLILGAYEIPRALGSFKDGISSVQSSPDASASQNNSDSGSDRSSSIVCVVPAESDSSTAADGSQAGSNFDRGVITASATVAARDLVNSPANVLYPESYAESVSTAAAELGIDVEIYDEDRLRTEGFGGLVAVGQGSARPPRLVHLTWNPSGAQKHVALVGKGITFDTGGISIKPASTMENMISDMGGSAASLAAIFGAAALGLEIKVEAWLAMAENMPDGAATRPGDIITIYGGRTVEVLNTDAEGRLVLADAIARASENHPDYLIDTATLTGAQLVALGLRTAGIMGTPALREHVVRVGQEVDENAWAMPLPDELAEALKSPVADLRNVTNSRLGGMSVAGCFLREFVGTNSKGEPIEWAHLDVAGPAFNTEGEYGFTPRRATGAPTRTLIGLLSELAQPSEI